MKMLFSFFGLALLTLILSGCATNATKSNTLHLSQEYYNYYQPQLEALALKSKLVSFGDVAKQKLEQEGIKKVALLGSDPVTDLGDWSPYRQLKEVAEVEVPDPELGLHQLIYDVKTYGGDMPFICESFTKLVDSLEADLVLLACTELPLIPIKTHKQLIDVTDLVAQELAKLSQAQ